MATKKISTESSIANTYKLSRGVASAAIPNAPTIGIATKVNDVSATVTYTAAVLGATASSFSALSSPGSLTGTGSSPITISGLTPETTYTFTVRATNANGNSAYSEASNSITTDPVLDSGVMFPIGMVNVGSTSTSYIEFTSIPQTYKHLQIRFFAGFNTQPGFASGKSYLNGDTTNTNYKSHQLNGDGTSATASAYSVPYLPISTGPDGYPCSYVIDLLDYTSTSKNKTIRALGGWDANGSGQMILGSAVWLNTAAVTSYRIQCDGGYNWKQYTSATLYGIKGA